MKVKDELDLAKNVVAEPRLKLSADQRGSGHWT